MKRFAILSLCVLATPAMAQIAPPLPNPNQQPGDVYIPTKQEQLGAVQVRKAMLRFGSCVAGRHQREAQRFVEDATLMFASNAQKILDSDCLSDSVTDAGDVELQTYPSEVRYALAEALIRKTLQRTNPDDLRRAAPLAVVSTDPAAIEKARAYLALDALGECVVRANPGSAHSLLGAEPGSKAEALTLQLLTPSFGTCLPQGREFHADLATLRGTIAVGYYRLATAPKLPPKGERGE